MIHGRQYCSPHFAELRSDYITLGKKIESSPVLSCAVAPFRFELPERLPVCVSHYLPRPVKIGDTVEMSKRKRISVIAAPA